MPQVKIDHIVSFSSEDPSRPAKSLCNSGVGPGWRSSVSERTASVVCGLQRAVNFSSLTVGVVNVALVEVLVGRSEKPDHYEVLVPRCVVLSPMESRRGGGDRVRTWGTDCLTPLRDQLWDRVKLVCSQPYDPQAQYGVSFIHVFSPSEIVEKGVQLEKESRSLCVEEDEEEFTPGDLWRRHLNSSNTNNNTDAQIRQASSQAFKNVKSETQSLVKTKLGKEKQSSNTSEGGRQRDRDNLLYDSDDDKPHNKIDNAINKHRKEKEKDRQHKQQSIQTNSNTKDTQSTNNENETDNRNKRDSARERHKSKEKESKTNEKSKKEDTNDSVDNKRTEMKRRSVEKRNITGEDGVEKKNITGEDGVDRKRVKIDEDKKPLEGVVFTISGYVDPRRGLLRKAGLALGGRYRTDVSTDVTHVLAAYHNTPKVRAAAPGTVIVLGEWIEECKRQGANLNPGPYLTDPAKRKTHTATPARPLVTSRARPLVTSRASPSDSDTDDEIQRVLNKGDTQRDTQHGDTQRGDSQRDTTLNNDDTTSITGDTTYTNGSNEWSDSAGGDTEEEGGERGERVDPGGDTEEEGGERGERVDPGGDIPDLLKGRTVRLQGGNVELLKRYIIAYGGTLAHESSDTPAEVCIGGEDGISPSWLWDLHSSQTVPPLQDYLPH